MVVFNENKTLFFKLSIVGTWPSGTDNRSMQLTFSGSVPDTLVSSRNSATTTDNILLATFFSVDKDGFLATNGSTLTIQSNGAAFGVNPHDVAQMYQQNPRQFGEFVDHLGMNSLGPEKYFDLQDKMQGRQVTMRGQDLDSQTAARNQAITMRGQDIQANLGQQRINLDAETNRINNENKRLDRMLSAETNDLKRQEIQSRIAANNQQLQQKQQALNDGYKDGINTLTTSMFTLNDIVSSPSLKSITGLRGVIPNVPGSQAADTQARLDTFKSQAYLTAVQAMRGMGALSDAEGKKLDQAVGSLQNSQSEESFRRNAGVILNTLNQKRNEAVGKYVQQNGIKRVEAPQASIDYLKQHPELSIDFINRYGYLPSLGQ